jgi:hypothetical protein
MNLLRNYASQIKMLRYVLPSGKPIELPTWIVRFPPANPARLTNSILKSTYTSKPLVVVDDEPVFGEIAIARWLAKDGWNALWVDTFHGKKFWKGMPDRTSPVEPPPPIRALYDRIAAIKGSAGGCFDVVGWSGSQIAWFEYKGPGDKPNRNEGLWIEAALQAGVTPDNLILIGNSSR